ncbi:SCO family protein [Polaribacter sp. MSW13]|uniref:SCO family protein n=1 Tax=Polaribacter marinus TaxID=2916838 RepID=A0A9X2ALH3_9FLAO|nr:SCO family protein [Polaribacter marinus]MCI2227834.1 SCO family protein [Polaribacter marinus]
MCCKTNQKKEETSRVDALPYFNEASFTPKWISPTSKELTSFHRIPDFNLVNQNGETVTQKTFENKIYVADFFFTTCPGICPMMTSNMYKIQEEFKNDNDVLLLSHSVTPEKDSVVKLKEYALEKKIDDKKWHLVTGDRKQIYDLGRQFYFVEENLGEPLGIDDFLHTENFVLIDKNKHIRGIYNGLNRASIAQLIVDIKALKNEK